MSMSTESEVYYDPYDVALIADPYPTYRRLRDEAPLYYNARYDFYALSRYADINKAVVDHDTFSSGRGAIVEVIKANLAIPSGMLIFEDPPIHTVHRKLLSRMFTPRKVNALEPKIREFCAQALDPLVGSGRFDFVKDLGAQMPMKVIGMLLGIPDDDQEFIRNRADAQMRTEAGKPMKAGLTTGKVFAAYIDWRAEHPSDDIMTELLNVEFVDEAGSTRRLTRDELLVYLNVVAGAGNETTTRLIGWAGKVLAEHPDQRAELATDPSLVPAAIEELLRYEPPGPHTARYVTTDVEIHDQTLPEGSVVIMLLASACRDHRHFGADADEFNIHREPRQHLALGVGTHFCLGAALARLEGRIALEEILTRFPEWEVDLTDTKLSPTSTVRGWESMPALVS